MVDGRKQVTSVNHTYTRSTLCIEHCFTDFKFKPLIYIYIYFRTLSAGCNIFFMPTLCVLYFCIHVIGVKENLSFLIFGFASIHFI